MSLNAAADNNSKKPVKQAAKSKYKKKNISKLNLRWLYFDESGIPGHSCKTDEVEYFIIGGTAVKDPKSFGEIAEKYPKHTRFPRRGIKTDELKYSDTSDAIRLEVLKDIQKLDPDVYYTVVKLMPNDPNPISKNLLYEAALYECLSSAMKKLPPDNYAIHLDDSYYINADSFQRLLKEINTECSRYGRKIDLKMSSKMRSCDSRQLQTNDFIIGSIRDWNVTKKDTYGISRLRCFGDRPINSTDSRLKQNNRKK